MMFDDTKTLDRLHVQRDENEESGRINRGLRLA
jgi:hypothetical protein